MRKPSARARLRVASVPAAHPYVDGLGLEEAGLDVLPDPPVPGAPLGRWWPPVMLDPAWVARHADDFDVMHIHFGMESLTDDALGRWLASLRAAGRPLVHTVHDLVHPQLADQTRHRAHLERIVPAADGLITLTASAADEIERRYGRRPLVLPHPALATPRGPAEGRATVPVHEHRPLVGAHLRDLRPGIDGPGTVDVLAGALQRLRRAGVSAAGRVWMHDRVRDPALAAEVRSRCAALPMVELREHARPDDRALERELESLSVAVLPYRHGTHSGWVELCWDLAVPVAGPAVGHFAVQHPERGFYRTFAPGDAQGLAAALAALLVVPEAAPGGIARERACVVRQAERVRTRSLLGARHAELYRELAATVGPFARRE